MIDEHTSPFTFVVAAFAAATSLCACGPNKEAETQSHPLPASIEAPLATPAAEPPISPEKQAAVARIRPVEPQRVYNREAVIPPQCYTRTEGRHNPCYVCHQTYPGRERPNLMSDGVLQGDYAFSDFGRTNRWSNLFEDRSEAAAEISEQQVLDWVNGDNYSPLVDTLRGSDWRGFVPDLAELEKGAVAFDEQGFAKDGSNWVAFRYKPLPSTFWPTNGSTDDVMIRLPEAFRSASCKGETTPSRDLYLANLAVVEAAIKDLESISVPPIDERKACADVDGDGQLTTATEVVRPERYFGAASDVEVAVMLYPEGTEFLHSVRYLGIDAEGKTTIPARMKELRYMKKIRFLGPGRLRTIYGNEHQEKREENLPRLVYLGDRGLDNGFGWMLSGFIEDAEGDLRHQSREEHLFCKGCHSTVGTTIDQTFSFARKVEGAKGWGYIDLHGMPDAPTLGQEAGEVLTYLRRVGGGSEFRENPEMHARWFGADGRVDEAKVRAAADLFELLTPSRGRALDLNRAYMLIVKAQSFAKGRDATSVPAKNVYQEVDAEEPLDLEFRYDYDIRLDWPH